MRKSASLSQDSFGDVLGLSRQYVTLLETGQREPSDRTIRDICREFCVNETWLRTGAGEMRLPRSREEEMTDAVARLMSTAPDSFKASLVAVMLRFDPDGPEWEVVERIYNSVAAEIEKGPGQ